MNKELLDQVQQALTAQEQAIITHKKTIAKQESYLIQKDRDIEELKASLKKLAQTQAKELQALPALFSDLKKSNTNTVSGFKQLATTYAQYQKTTSALAKELQKLAILQENCIKLMMSYHKALPEQQQAQQALEQKLSELMKSQKQIDSSKSLLTDTQTEIEKRIETVNKSLNTLDSKLEKLNK